jgi:hypothetical protein
MSSQLMDQPQPIIILENVTRKNNSKKCRFSSVYENIWAKMSISSIR